MKKLFPILMLVAFVLAACAPVQGVIQGVVVLPPETQVVLAGLVGLLVLVAFNYIGTLAPWAVPFLSKYKDEISAALSGAFIGWLSNLLPGGQWAGASVAGINFIIALIAGFLGYGALHFIRNVKAKLNA